MHTVKGGVDRVSPIYQEAKLDDASCASLCRKGSAYAITTVATAHEQSKDCSRTILAGCIVLQAHAMTIQAKRTGTSCMLIIACLSGFENVVANNTHEIQATIGNILRWRIGCAWHIIAFSFLRRLLHLEFPACRRSRLGPCTLSIDTG